MFDLKLYLTLAYIIVLNIVYIVLFLKFLFNL